MTPISHSPSRSGRFTGARAPYDEAWASAGTPRDAYEEVLEELGSTDLDRLAGRVATTLEDRGVTFGRDDDPFPVDAVPRIITREEWEPLARGLGQRVKALDRFVADVYGDREAVREGVIPREVLASTEFLEPRLVHALRGRRTWITIAGLDLVRCPDGTFMVLEDNVRTPSGLGYALAARSAVMARLGHAVEATPLPLEPSLDALGRVLRAAAPEGRRDDPLVAIVSDGPSNVAFYEHELLANRLGIALVAPRDLSVRGGDLTARIDGRVARVDVLYRRTDEDRLSDPRGGTTELGELLLGPWAANRVGLVNGFGTGVADDKLVHRHVEDLVRFYLGEEPLLRSVPTLDLSGPSDLEAALARLPELVVKPRAGHGGSGVVVGPTASEAELRQAADALRNAPDAHIVQETVPLSVHPTVIDGRLEPRHVDLRPFTLLSQDEVHVVPGGLTRVAFDEGEMVVNSSRNGGAKDTWIV